MGDSGNWKLDILSGKLPRKSSGYENFMLRQDMYEFYHKINNVRYISSYERSELLKELAKNEYVINKIYEFIMSSAKPVNIIFKTNKILKISIQILGDKNKDAILIKVPVIEDEW